MRVFTKGHVVVSFSLIDAIRPKQGDSQGARF